MSCVACMVGARPARLQQAVQTMAWSGKRRGPISAATRRVDHMSVTNTVRLQPSMNAGMHDPRPWRLWYCGAHINDIAICRVEMTVGTKQVGECFAVLLCRRIQPKQEGRSAAINAKTSDQRCAQPGPPAPS